MCNNHKEIIAESIVDIFEKVAFLFPMPADEETDMCGDPGNEMTCIGLSFHGHTKGESVLSLPTHLTREIAANMLGIDDEDPDVDQKSLDAAKEILNIICGNILPRIYGEGPVFYLNAPYIIKNKENLFDESKNYDISKIQLDVDESIVTFIYAVEQ